MSVDVHAVAPTTTAGGAVTTPARTTANGQTVILGLLVNEVSGFPGFGGTPIADNKGNTFIQVGTDVPYGGPPTDFFILRLYKSVNIAGGAGHTWTLTPAANNFAALFVQVVGGVGTAPTVLSSANADATSPYTTGNISPGAACTLVGVFASNAVSGTETDTWGGSFASGDKTDEITDANTSLCGSIAAVDKAAGTYSASVTESGATVTATAVAVISVETGANLIKQDFGRTYRPRPFAPGNAR